MQQRITSLFILLLISMFIAHAIRTDPADPQQTPLKDAEKVMSEKMEGCEGVAEEDCLIRRTLVAHTDYIYTQESHH